MHVCILAHALCVCLTEQHSMCEHFCQFLTFFPMSTAPEQCNSEEEAIKQTLLCGTYSLSLVPYLERVLSQLFPLSVCLLFSQE